MDSEVLAALLAVLGTIIAGLLALVGVLVRRNGKQNHNPNLGTIDEKLTQLLLAVNDLKGAISTLKEVIKGCPAVRQG